MTPDEAISYFLVEDAGRRPDEANYCEIEAGMALTAEVRRLREENKRLSVFLSRLLSCG